MEPLQDALMGEAADAAALSDQEANQQDRDDNRKRGPVLANGHVKRPATTCAACEQQ